MRKSCSSRERPWPQIWWPYYCHPAAAVRTASGSSGRGCSSQTMEAEQQQQGKEPSKCGVCGKAAAKYTCPRCQLHTCSLGCVKGERRAPTCGPLLLSPSAALRTSMLPLFIICCCRFTMCCPTSLPGLWTAAHKSASGCSGKRDHAAFVGRADFDERAFMSDYRSGACSAASHRQVPARCAHVVASRLSGALAQLGCGRRRSLACWLVTHAVLPNKSLSGCVGTCSACLTCSWRSAAGGGQMLPRRPAGIAHLRPIPGSAGS